MEELNVMDFLSVLLRKKKLFLTTFVTLFVLGAFGAFQWSNYRSIATVELALPEISQQAAELGTASSQQGVADAQISYLQQKILSTGSLVEIITKFNLYQRDREARPIAELADAMRKKINLSLVSNSFSTAGGQKTPGQISAIAFTLSFDYFEPLLAQQVTNELVSRFLDEDIKQRRSRAQGTTSFLEAQIKTLEASLVEQEKKIADFRIKYGETRPDALAFNQQTASSLMMSLQNAESQITTNIGSQGALLAQLAAIDPYSRVVGEDHVLTTPSLQLRAAKSEYASLSAKYGPDHPDVLKARLQMEVLAKQAPPQDRNASGTLQALVLDTKAKLSASQKIKGVENPDVQVLQGQLANLEKQLREESKKTMQNALIKADADNPTYLSTVAQLRTVQEQGAALQAQKESLQAQFDRYQNAVIENPEVEQQMAVLMRDYTNAQERYRQLQAQKLESQMNETIEKDRVGQRLVIINPPELPTQTQPSRKLLLMASFVLAFVSGVFVVGGSQLASQSVIGAAHLASIVGAAPLVVIPHIVTERERVRLTRHQLRLAMGGVIGLVVVAILFSMVVMPLDVLFAILMRKMGL